MKVCYYDIVRRRNLVSILSLYPVYIYMRERERETEREREREREKT